MPRSQAGEAVESSSACCGADGKTDNLHRRLGKTNRIAGQEDAAPEFRTDESLLRVETWPNRRRQSEDQQQGPLVR